MASSVSGQSEALEHALRIGPKDFHPRTGLKAIAKSDGDEALHDMGVTLSPLKMRRGAGPVGRAIDLSREPDLTGAAANSVRLRSRRQQRRQGAAEARSRSDSGPPSRPVELEVREDVLEASAGLVSAAMGTPRRCLPGLRPSPDIAVARRRYFSSGSYHAIREKEYIFLITFLALLSLKRS